MEELNNDTYKTIAALAAQVKGFLAEDEGRALYDIALTAANLGPCLEIGSFCGKSAVYIGAACQEKGVTLFTIDHHRGSEEQQPGQLYFDPDIYDAKNAEINSLPLLRNTLRTAGLEDTVAPLVTWSKVAVKNWATPLGLVFIDGGHSYESALSDYQCWSRCLLPGGFLIFHDIYLDVAKGGQAPRQVYEKALQSGDFDQLPMVNTLGILRKRNIVVVEKKVCC
jgi:predicted O-methyltransferase YrrM